MEPDELQAAMDAAQEKADAEKASSDDDDGVRDRGKGPYSKFYKLGSGGIVLLFGPSKAGKTKMCITVAIDAAKLGFKVIYWDLEHNLHQNAVDAMVKAGVDYRAVENLKKAKQPSRKSDADVIIVDSCTHHITGLWYEKQKMNDKGNMLLEIQNFAHRMSQWASANEALVLMVAQPTSSFGGKAIQPVGDKMGFFCKETLWVEKNAFGNKLEGKVEAWGSRVFPPDLCVFKYETEAVGVKIKYTSPELKKL